MSTSTQSSRVPCEKSRKIGCVEPLSLSNLPDWAISHILLRLPIKDVVRTSVLSKDWECKWMLIRDIELHDIMWAKRSKKSTFANFVERTLFQAESVQSLSVSRYKKYDLDRMKTWILVALSRDVHNLKIYCLEASIVLPRNLLNSYSLRRLELHMPCTFKVLAEICFLKLTTLCLVDVEISNELSPFDRVKFNLPVLEKLGLIRCKWLNVMFVEIYAPKMTSFESEIRTEYSIKIIGDGFVRYKSRGGLLERILLAGYKVVYADLDTSYGSNNPHLLERNGHRIRKLLNGFQSLQELELSGLVAKAIMQGRLGLSLPRYCDMERLVLYSFGTVEALFHLLRVAPSLKFLVIHVAGWSVYDYDKEYTPSCIVLEVVSFKGFGGEINELRLPKNFLKNAVQLKSVCLFVRGQPQIPRNEITKELSAYPTASTCVNIIVP